MVGGCESKMMYGMDGSRSPVIASKRFLTEVFCSWCHGSEVDRYAFYWEEEQNNKAGGVDKHQ